MGRPKRRASASGARNNERDVAAGAGEGFFRRNLRRSESARLCAPCGATGRAI